MDQQNTTVADQGTTQAPDARAKGAVDTPAKLYASKSEAEANKPADATKAHKPYEMSKNGTVVGWLWARGYENAYAQVAKADGYSASLGGGKEVTKEAVASKLSEFSDAELAALGLSRKKGKK